MKYNLITDYRKLDREKWSTFVSWHTFGNIFHTPEMVNLYDSTKNREPIVIVCLDESRDFVGLLVSEIQKEYSGFPGKITSRAIVMGGPLVKDENPEIVSLLLTEFNKICQSKVVYSQFRNLWPTDNIRSGFISNKFIFEDHLNFIFDLGQGEEDLWKNIHPTRRKQIIRGLKRGLSVSLPDNIAEEEFDACLNILIKVYNEAKLPCPNKSYFANAYRILSSGGHLKIAIAKFEQQIVGFRFILCYKDMLYDWYAGSLSEHHDKYPNDILPWELMRWGTEHHYKMFDFGGAGKPGVPYGVRDYKVKFGGELVNYGRYEKIHKPIVYKFAKMGFSVWKILKFR